MSDIKVAAIWQPHNDYTDKRKQYENGLYSDEDDCCVVASQTVILIRENNMKIDFTVMKMIIQG